MRLITRIVVVVALVVAFIAAVGLSPAPAQAGDLAKAKEAAYQMYPDVVQKCPQGVTVEEGETRGYPALAEYWNCRVPTAPGVLQDEEQAWLCAMMVHEWGHISRQSGWHSDDPTNHMYGGKEGRTAVKHPACGPSQDEVRVLQDWIDGQVDRANERIDALAARRADLREAIREIRSRRASRRRLLRSVNRRLALWRTNRRAWKKVTPYDVYVHLFPAPPPETSLAPPLQEPVQPFPPSPPHEPTHPSPPGDDGGSYDGCDANSKGCVTP